jgi:aspartyl-tRNA(Asn)/glutamyl-tRNA(Gln) amidotransferase subunit C
MSVTLQEVDRIAALAKLEFSTEEKQKFTEQFNHILQYIEKLNELDLTNVAPTHHVWEAVNVFREDQVQPSLSQDQALANAPNRKMNFFSVPKVIG